MTTPATKATIQSVEYNTGAENLVFKAFVATDPGLTDERLAFIVNEISKIGTIKHISPHQFISPILGTFIATVLYEGEDKWPGQTFNWLGTGIAVDDVFDPINGGLKLDLVTAVYGP